VSAFFLRRLLGHLDGPRIANSYIRMGYAALGSAVAGVGALWLLGSYSPVGFAWSSRPAALVTIVVVGPIMLTVYLLLLKLFRVTELRDLLRPLLGRLGRGGGAPAAATASADAGPAGADSAGGAAASAVRRPRPERATISVDTGLIPRISGEFDAASFRAGPAPQPEPEPAHDGRSADEPASYLPEEDVPSTARGNALREQIPLPGRRTFQGTPGQNPYFKHRRKKNK
jgi:putative peptidoglycan lipid II flippase